MFSMPKLEFQILADATRALSQLDGLNKSLGNMSGAVDFAKKAFVGLTGVASVGALAGIIKSSLDAAGALNDLSIKTGLSVEALSKFKDIGRTSGTTVETVAAAVNKMSKALVTSNEDSKGAAQSLKALGINFNDFVRMSPDSQMQTVAVALNKVADGSGKSAAAMALFGKTGADLLPFMADLAEAGDYQARITTEQAKAADEFGDNLAKLQTAGGAWKDELAMGMAPALAKASGAFLDVINGSGGLRDQLQNLVKDGSIQRWTEGALNFISYAIDGFAYLKRAIVTVADYLGAWVAQFAAQIGAIGSAFQKAFTGDFKGAWEELQNGARQTDAIWKEFADNTAARFGEDTMGAMWRARMADVKNLAKTSQEAKPQLDMKGVLDGNEKAAQADAEAKKALAEENKKLASAVKEARAEHEKAVGSLERETESLQKQVEKQRETNEAYGLSAEQLGMLEIQKLRDAAATAQRNALVADEMDMSGEIAAEYRAQADALLQLADLKEQGIQKQAAQESAAEWKRTTESIQTGMTDALFRAFEEGKGFGQAFRDTLENTFKTLILKPTLDIVMKPINDAIGNVFKDLMGGKSGIPGIPGTGAGGPLSGMMKTLEPMIAKAVPILAVAYMANKVGTAVADGYSVGGFAGKALNSFGAVGGLLNRAFGRRAKETTETGVTGSFVGGDFSGNEYADWMKKGGWFRSTKRGTDLSPLDREMADALDAGGAAIFASVTEYARTLKLPADSLRSVNHTIRVKLGEDAEENRRAVDEALKGYGDALSAGFESILTPFKHAGESLAETLQRLSELQVFTDGINTLGGIFSRVAALSIDAKEELLGFAGGIEAFIAKAQQFVATYYSTEEQLGISATSILDQLRKLGITSDVNSLADFRKLVESTDISTSEGRKKLDALLTLSQQFAPVGKYLEEQGKTLSELAKAAPQTELLGSILDEQRVTTDAQEQIVSGIDTLNGSIASMSDVIRAAIEQLRADLTAGNVAIATNTQTTARLLQSWDDGGSLLTTASP